jgi:hypothetical protein
MTLGGPEPVSSQLPTKSLGLAAPQPKSNGSATPTTTMETMMLTLRDMTPPIIDAVATALVRLTHVSCERAGLREADGAA